jgi:DNA-binding response OmpR family regulator
MEARILLVDGDRWAQRVVMSALGDRDYRIDTASDGIIGLARALRDPPNLVISDVRMPGMSGWRLVRRMRAYRQLAGTAYIFLSTMACPESRRHSLRLGADDYLIKPCHPRELALRVANVLRRGRTPARGREPERGRGFRGAIEDISLASVLVLLEMERKTGLLIVHHAARGRRCRVFLRDGRIVSAVLDGDDGVRHAELLYDVLHWSAGVFEFKALPVEMRDEVQASTTHLVMEATRRLDEARRGAYPCGPGDVIW